MKKVKISDKIWINSRRDSIKMGALKHSFMNGEGNLCGSIAEQIVQDYLNCERRNTFDYDLIYNGLTIDVKSARTSVIPLSHYQCSIPAKQANQKCDYYYFVRVLKDYSYAYILGYIKKEDFFNQATYYKKGEDMSGKPALVNCYSIPVFNLLSGKIKV